MTVIWLLMVRGVLQRHTLTYSSQKTWNTSSWHTFIKSALWKLTSNCIQYKAPPAILYTHPQLYSIPGCESIKDRGKEKNKICASYKTPSRFWAWSGPGRQILKKRERERWREKIYRICVLWTVPQTLPSTAPCSFWYFLGNHEEMLEWKLNFPSKEKKKNLNFSICNHTI